MTTLREFIETASNAIDRIFRKSHVIRPMWHAVTRDGQELVFPTTMPDKDMEIAMARAIFELRDVVRYAFINEAWMVDAFGQNRTPEKLEAVRQAIETGASKSPVREEIVMISAEDEREGSLLARRKIIRPSHGHAKLGPLLLDMPGGEFAGRFVGLLPRKNAKLQ